MLLDGRPDTDLLDTALDAVVGLDASGTITYWNGGAEQAFGWQRSEALGRALFDLVIPEAARETYKDGLRRFLVTGEAEVVGRRMETVGLRRSGAGFPLEIAITATAGASGHAFTAFMRDLTGRRLSEAECARRLSEAQESNRLKDEFLATLSHELRTPLNAIVGWAHMLKTGALDAATTARAVETIERNARVQNQMIGNILDISRIVAGKLRLEMETVDPARVVEAALDSVRLGAEARQVRLVSRVDAEAGPLWGDPDRLQQVVWNLLANAIQFTPAEGTVTVSLARTTDAEGASRAEITVQDTGVGIGADVLPHVFERFRQDNALSRRSGGLGLGLAIVRHLVGMHAGTIEAESAGPEKGATFRVRLPLIVQGRAA